MTANMIATENLVYLVQQNSDREEKIGSAHSNYQALPSPVTYKSKAAERRVVVHHSSRTQGLPVWLIEVCLSKYIYK